MSELHGNEQSLEMLDAMEIGIVFCASDIQEWNDESTVTESTQLQE